MTLKIVPKLFLLTGAAALTLSLSACSTQAKEQAASQSPAASSSATSTPEEPKSTPAAVVEGDRPQVVGSGADTAVGFPKDMPAPDQNTAWVVQEGTGAVVSETDTVTANYVGQVWGQGDIFDSSFARGEAASFSLQQVIPGWTQGLSGQKVGAKVILGIPSEMAYGQEGRPPAIPPNSPLAFYVEIVDAQPAS